MPAPTLTKAQREYVDILHAFGIQITDYKRGGNHLLALCQTPNGFRFKIPLPTAIGCPRTLKNLRTTVRHHILDAANNQQVHP